MRTVCAWCKRSATNGRAEGPPLDGPDYANASHGFCEECFDAFEAKATADDIARSERVRRENTQTCPGVAQTTLRLVCK